MTPLEAIAEALKEHVFENDEDFERWCARFLRSLKASGYRLMPCESDEERLARVKGSAETRPAESVDPQCFAKLADATDPLRHLKAQEEAYRKARETREGEA